jgi:adenine deaminase
MTTVRNGTPSLQPAYNDIHNNFVIANYGGMFVVVVGGIVITHRLQLTVAGLLSR